MILVNNIKFPLHVKSEAEHIARELKIPVNDILSAQLYRRSLDCRHKNDIHYTCSYVLSLKNESYYLEKLKNAKSYEKPVFSFPKTECDSRPIVIGFGPAGMFCAYVLAKMGQKPIVFERGCDVDTRTAAAEHFMATGEWSDRGNIQFGEGGAGTFSDGKLNSGISDGYSRFVLETFVECGADADILTDAKPHVGTDVLRTVVKNLRNKIISLGGEINFETALVGFDVTGGRVNSVTVKNNTGEKTLPADKLILAIGHSARDTFRMLKSLNIPMEQKPFAIGARIEHSQQKIDRTRYGGTKGLPPADYHLSVQLKNGRGAFSFCMCPGGVVVDARSDSEHIVTNGMSYKNRDGKNANSALLIGVSPEDFNSDDVLGGMYLQEKIESTACSAGGGHPVSQTVGDFLNGVPSTKFGTVSPSVRPFATPGDICAVLPDFITDSMREALPLLDKKLPGFSDGDAVLTAPETRSSSPVRILRGENRQSTVSGLFPCGEGAGYAGGILSAAVDGIYTALAATKFSKQG